MYAAQCCQTPTPAHVLCMQSNAGGKIRNQIIEGAESSEMMACVVYEAIVGDFYMWPILHAIKHKYADGSDPHILDMCPIYQEAYANLVKASEPGNLRLVATGKFILLPTYPHLYPEVAPTHENKVGRRDLDMQRIYAELEADSARLDMIVHLLSKALSAIANVFYEHTRDLQADGVLFLGDGPSLRQKLAGCSTTNTVVECIFAMEKFLSTREKGSLLRTRRGWNMFRYNNTPFWMTKLQSGKLVKYTNICRREGYMLKDAEEGRNQQLKRMAAHKQIERTLLLNKKRSGLRAKAEELERLSNPALRASNFSQLKLLDMKQLGDQLKLRALVDGRREANGKPLVRQPPKVSNDTGEEGGRRWLVYKLQSLMRAEFAEGLLTDDPDDLASGDAGAAKHRSSRGEKCRTIKGRKRQRVGGGRRMKSMNMKIEMRDMKLRQSLISVSSRLS